VLDLRWLNPLPAAWVGRHAAECGRVLVVDEGRRTGGLGEALVTAVVEHAPPGIRQRRIAGADSYIPLGPAAGLVLPSEDEVLREGLALIDD
jgi:2-oxoisovalerate dehydrogenase E1 component